MRGPTLKAWEPCPERVYLTSLEAVRFCNVGTERFLANRPLAVDQVYLPSSGGRPAKLYRLADLIALKARLHPKAPFND